jgi:protocatechuate 3,4-dioxygenase beta subunit
MTTRWIGAASVGVLALVSVSVAALTAQGQTRDQQTPVPLSGTGIIAGVVREPAGPPVRRAKVTVNGDMRLDRSVLTDDDGRFSIGELPEGRFTLTAEKPGYPRMSYGAKTPFRTGAGIFLRDGQPPTEIALTLARGAVLSGTVYDDRGEPMPGLNVMAWEVRTSLAGERTLDMPATGGEWVTTDEQGRYRIYGLPPGQYTFGTYWAYHGQGSDVRTLTAAELDAAFAAGATTAPPPSSLPAESAHYNYSPVFTPGVTDPLAAATYTLGPGEERAGVDLRMQFVPMASVEATFTGPTGAAVPSRIMLSRRGPVSALNTSQISFAGSGTYRSTSLSPTAYTLLAQVEATKDTPAMWARADFHLTGGQALKLALTLQPALIVHGNVRFAPGPAAPPKDLSRVVFTLRSAGRGADAEIETTVTAGGAATMTGVVPGMYSLYASVPPGISNGATWALKSAVINGQEVADRAFEIPAGGIGLIEATFSDEATELTGVLTSVSGGPATDYFVIAIPAERVYWLPQSRRIVSTRPDGAGRYAFRGLPPGDYRIALTTDLIPRDLQDPAALERLLAASAAFTLRAGEKHTLDLKAGG